MKLKSYNTFRINESVDEFSNKEEIGFIFQELLDEGYAVTIRDVYARNVGSDDNFDISILDTLTDKCDGYYPSYMIVISISNDTLRIEGNDIDSLLSKRIDYYRLLQNIVNKLSKFKYKVSDSSTNEFKFLVLDSNYKNIKFDKNSVQISYFNKKALSMNISIINNLRGVTLKNIYFAPGKREGKWGSDLVIDYPNGLGLIKHKNYLSFLNELISHHFPNLSYEIVSDRKVKPNDPTKYLVHSDRIVPLGFK